MNSTTVLSLVAILVLGIMSVFVIVYQVNHGLLCLLSTIIGALAGYKVGSKKAG